jgi:phosphatidylglycerophosphatase A
MTLRIAYALATWFGCGRIPLAPGTAGTLAALPLYWALRGLGGYGVLAGAIVITALGIWSSGHVARSRGEKDPQIVVIDEVAGMLVTLIPGADDWITVLAGFVAFRMFDQWKPWPASLFEARLPQGWGIVLDDVAAGAWAAIFLLALRNWLGS